MRCAKRRGLTRALWPPCDELDGRVAYGTAAVFLRVLCPLMPSVVCKAAGPVVGAARTGAHYPRPERTTGARQAGVPPSWWVDSDLGLHQPGVTRGSTCQALPHARHMRLSHRAAAHA